MARPPAEGTKRRIREAAAELFARHGVGRTTVREIAAAADVNVAMVSHHFGGKEPLYRACLEAMYAELDGMQAQLLTALAEHDDLGRAVREAVIGGYRYACVHRPAARLVMRHVIDTGGVPQKRRDTLLVPFLDAASRPLARRTGRSEAELRTILMSLMFLTTHCSRLARHAPRACESTWPRHTDETGAHIRLALRTCGNACGPAPLRNRQGRRGNIHNTVLGSRRTGWRAPARSNPVGGASCSSGVGTPRCHHSRSIRRRHSY